MPKDNDQTDQDDKEGKQGEHKGMPKPTPKLGHYPPQTIEHNDGKTDESKSSETS
jgi:hypothetical protein